MNRKFFFVAAVVGLGTLAGCSRSENPMAPAAAPHSQASTSTGKPTSSGTTTTSATATDAAPGDSLPGGSNGVVWSTGGN